MGYKSGGLSYFEDGGSSDADESSAVLAKPAASKGKYALPSPVGNVPISQSVLDKMEQLYLQRQGSMNSFMEAMKDAQAWWSGGIEGPGAALAKRDEIKREREAEMFQMQSQIAQHRAALEQNKQLGTKLDAIFGGGQTQTSAGAMKAPGAAGEFVYNGVPIPASIMAQINLLRSQPGGNQAALDRLNKYVSEYESKRVGLQFNPAGMDIVEASYNNIPVQMTKVEYDTWTKTGKWPERFAKLYGPDKFASATPGAAVSPAASAPADKTQPVSVRNNNPGNLVDPKTGQIRTFASAEEGSAALQNDIATKLSGISPAFKARFGDNVPVTPATLASVWSPEEAKGNSLESTMNYAKHIASKLGIPINQPIPNTPEAKAAVAQAITEFESGQRGAATQVAQTGPKDPSLAAPAPLPQQGPSQGQPQQGPAQGQPQQGPAQGHPPVQVASAAAPTLTDAMPEAAPQQAPVQVAQAAPQPSRAMTLPEIKAQQAIDEDRAKKANEEDVKRETALVKEGQAAANDIRTYDAFINIARNNPGAVGLGQRGGLTSAAIALSKDGITIPIIGTANAKNLEEALAQTSLTKEEREARSKLATLGQRGALAYRKAIYEGTGTVTEAENKAAEVAFGLSTSAPLTANLMFAVMHRERALMQQERYRAFQQFKAANKYGTMAQFEATDAYRNAEEKMDQRIRKAFPNVFNTGVSGKPAQKRSLDSFGPKK